jgi:hypothetical protein
MLPEHITELLSAYVDGELNSRERKNVTRILQKSDEARQLLHKLKQDSMILRKLPRKKTQLDLTESAMGTLSLRGIKLPEIPSAPPPSQFAGLPKRRRSMWVGIVAALVALVIIGIASFYFFAVTFRGNVVKQTGPESPPTSPENKSEGSRVDRPMPVIAVLHEPDTNVAPAKGLNPKADDRYGMTAIRMPRFVTPQPRLAPVLTLRDLDQPAAGRQLEQELSHDGASRIDLFCPTGVSTIGALDRLEAVCKANGVTLRIDAYAQSRKKQKLPTNYAIYCEDLSAAKWTQLFRQLAQEDKKSAGSQFDKLTITSLTPAEMAKALGGEPAHYQPSNQRPLPVDITRDASDKTAEQLAQSLTGQAVVVPYLPQPGFYNEVRYIVENRKGWRPGAIQVLIILWNQGP